MKVVRILFGLIAATWLIAVFAFGAGMTWLSHDPEAAAGVALGAATLDSNASLLENAETFGSGYAAGSELMGDLRNAEATYELRRKCENSKDSDWGAPRECAMLERSDTERAEQLKDGW